jgi:tetratricopeptide (TPR) repeat protein
MSSPAQGSCATPAPRAAALQLQPDHLQALICLGNVSKWLGAAPMLMADRAAALRPNSMFLQGQAALEALSRTPPKRDAALHFLQRARELEPTQASSGASHAWAWLFDAHEAWLRSDVNEALRVVDTAAARVASLSGEAQSVFAIHVAHAYHTLGRLDRAESVVTLIRTGPPERRLERLTIVSSREDPEALRAAIEREFGSELVNGGLGSALIDAGLLEPARRLLTTIDRVVPYKWLVEGQLALAEGRFDKAIDLLQQVMQPSTLENTKQQWMRAAVKLAEARSALGQEAHAIAVLEEAS